MKWKCAINQLILSICLVIQGRCDASDICSHCICLASFPSTSIEFNQKVLAISTPSVLYKISTVSFMNSSSSAAGGIEFFATSVNDSTHYVISLLIPRMLQLIYHFHRVWTVVVLKDSILRMTFMANVVINWTPAWLDSSLVSTHALLSVTLLPINKKSNSSSDGVV